MTPLQFAREECANHQPDGSCLGAVIGADLRIRACNPRPRCIVATGQRCAYFEQCVAPIADMVSDPKRARALQEAVAEYRQITNQKSPAARRCPDCGAPLQKGKQLCPACADRRRKATNRATQDRQRRPRDVLSAEVPKSTPSSLGNSCVILPHRPVAIEDSAPPQTAQTSADIASRRAS